MKQITLIEVQKRNKKRSNIYINGDYSFSLSNEIVYRENLKINEEVDEDRLLYISKEDSYIKCKDTALKIIERSYKTEKELIERLKNKGYFSDEIKRTIEFLKEYNFINNNEYARMYIKDRISSMGSRKIKYSLLNKGIEEIIIDELLEEFQTNEELEGAIKLGRKKYEQIIRKENNTYVVKNKLTTYLIGRGYDYSLVKDAINEIVNEY